MNLKHSARENEAFIKSIGDCDVQVSILSSMSKGNTVAFPSSIAFSSAENLASNFSFPIDGKLSPVTFDKKETERCVDWIRVQNQYTCLDFWALE